MVIIRSQKVNKKALQKNVLSEAAAQQQKLQEQQDLQDKLQRIAKMRMFDDTLMNAVFDSRIAETEVLIQIILGRTGRVHQCIRPDGHAGHHRPGC